MKSYCVLLLALLGAAPTLAQAPDKGMLLVATPELRDPRFSETVVLLLHYGSEGALGVAINRPTWVDPLAAARLELRIMGGSRSSKFGQV